MMKNSRTKSVYLNSLITFTTQIIQVLLGFWIRRLFIQRLGVEYLGYNSVFQNLLQMLNLADLGIGVSITSFLYHPLAVKDEKRIASLMYMYKKIYQIIGIFVLVVGVIVSFCLQYIITDSSCDIWYLRVLFYVNLIGTVSTYFLAYKRTLIIADQKSYIISIVDFVAFVIGTILQILVLCVFSNYIVYSIVTVGRNIVSNIIISNRAKKIYGDFSDNNDAEIIKEYKPQIFSYMKDVFVSRIGAYVYYGTDNIIISIFRGSLLAGYLSNYTLITTQVSSVVIQMLSSIQATYGNYVYTTEDVEKQKKMTDKYLCLCFFLSNFCTMCIMYLIQPFVELVFGENVLLDFSTVILLSINFLLTVLIQIPSQVFMIYKLYKYDKPIIIVSASLNIFVSAILVNQMGIDGALIGTLITSLFYLFSRFYVISKYVYKTQYWKYIISILQYLFYSFISCVFVNFAIHNFDVDSILSFLIRIIIVCLSAIAISGFGLTLSGEYGFVSAKLIPTKISKILTEKVVRITCLLFMILLILFGNL